MTEAEQNTRARCSLTDVALKHAEAEQKAMQEWSGVGGGTAVCALYKCVSQDMLCAVSFMMQYTLHNAQNTNRNQRY